MRATFFEILIRSNSIVSFRHTVSLRFASEVHLLYEAADSFRGHDSCSVGTRLVEGGSNRSTFLRQTGDIE